MEAKWKRKVRITFLEPLLGTLSGDKELATEHILSKHPEKIQPDEAEAVESIEDALEKPSTIFPKENGKPFLWDYQIRGFFKEAMASLCDAKLLDKEGMKKIGLSTWTPTIRQKVDRLLFVKPRKIFLNMPASPDFTERPLRCSTMKGDRIALARSETAPANTVIELEIQCFREDWEEVIDLALQYGEHKGLGQWRGSGMGSFKYEYID